MNNILQILALSSVAELVAVALAIAYIILAIRQSLWCWPAAAISASIYTVLFFSGKLYMESVLQVFYVLMAGYGYWQWRALKQQVNTNSAGAIRRLSLVWHSKWLLLLTAISLVVATLLLRFTDAEMAYLDTFTTVFSFFATFLVARKVLENWLYWVVIDVVYIGLFWSKGYYATSMLFVIYSVMALIGYWRWRQAWQAEQISNDTAEHVLGSAR